MKSISTKKLTMIAMFMALTTVATMVIQIPIPATKGYLNVGDTVVIASALLMGKMAGGLVGGIGSPWRISCRATATTPPLPWW